ncbi:MAG: pentapeptide repeat-containing protein, partial [Nodosilinea sp.]
MVVLWCLSSGTANAAIADDVQKLLDTNECPVCILNQAPLENLDLAHANLKIAVLTNANLAGANLQEANLMLSDLEAANLTGANLTQAQ